MDAEGVDNEVGFFYPVFLQKSSSVYGTIYAMREILNDILCVCVCVCVQGHRKQLESGEAKRGVTSISV